MLRSSKFQYFGQIEPDGNSEVPCTSVLYILAVNALRSSFSQPLNSLCNFQVGKLLQIRP